MSMETPENVRTEPIGPHLQTVSSHSVPVHPLEALLQAAAVSTSPSRRCA